MRGHGAVPFVFGGGYGCGEGVAGGLCRQQVVGCAGSNAGRRCRQVVRAVLLAGVIGGTAVGSEQLRRLCQRASHPRCLPRNICRRQAVSALAAGARRGVAAGIIGEQRHWHELRERRSRRYRASAPAAALPLPSSPQLKR